MRLLRSGKRCRGEAVVSGVFKKCLGAVRVLSVSAFATDRIWNVSASGNVVAMVVVSCYKCSITTHRARKSSSCLQLGYHGSGACERT